jgi:hypothetical protein
MISVPQTEPLATMPDRSLLWMVVAVGGYALLLASMMASPMTIFVPAVVFVCAARYGWRVAAVALALAGGALVALAVRFAQTPPVGPHDLSQNLFLFLGPFLSLGVPALLVLPLVQRKVAFGHVLVTATILGVAALGAIELVAQSTAGISPHATELEVWRAALAQAPKTNPAAWSAETLPTLQRFSAALLYCFEAFRATLIVLTFTFSLVLFGRVQAWREFAQHHELSAPVAYTFRGLVLPEWMLLVFVAAGLSPLATGMLRHVGLNVIAVVGVLYLLQGLAIVRWFIAAFGVSFLGAFVVYGILLLLTPISQLLLSIAGLFDSFFDYRHFNRKDSTHEGHSD